MFERDVEDYLVKRVKALGGEVRKVQWIGRNSAPDRLVMLPSGYPAYMQQKGRTIWVELKNPKTVVTFPADARERAQHREHERMRKMGQVVVVIGTLDQVEELLS